MAALAKAHGVSAEASNRAVEAVKKVGFGTQDAIHAVDRLMVADMNLSKAEGLAKVAKDAAAIENITPGEALEKLLMAIESGASRGLRTMGIFVDLNKEVDRQEKLTGRTLDENEVRQLRYNAVMREAAKIQGAAAAAAGSAEAQSAALAREVNELKEAVGEQFQGYLRSWVGHLRDLVGFLKDNSDWLVKFGEAAIFVAGAIVTYGIITKIAGIASAVQGLALALTANPSGLLLTGVVAAGAIIYYEYNKMHEGMDRTFDDMRRKGLQKDLFSGKLKPDDVKKMGYTDDQVKEIISGRRMLPGDSWDDFSGVGFPKLKILGKGELSDDEVNRIATERKKRGEAEKSAQELYMRAVEERKSAEHDQARARIEDSMKIIESTHSETQAAKESLNVVLLSMQERQAGIEKIKEEEKREIEQRSTYTDEKSGAVRHFKLNASTLETIHKATAERLAAFDMKFNEEESRRLEQMWKAAAARSQKMFELLYLEPMKQNLYVWEQESQWQDKIDDQGRSAAIAAVDQRKNLQLAQLESVDARTLQDKVALENAKTAIEVQAMKDRTKIELEEIDARTERQVDEAQQGGDGAGHLLRALSRPDRQQDPRIGPAREGRAPEGHHHRDRRGADQGRDGHAQTRHGPVPEHLPIAQAAGWRRIRCPRDQVAVGVVGHRELAEDRAAHRHQGRRDLARGGDADEHVRPRRQRADAAGRYRGQGWWRRAVRRAGRHPRDRCGPGVRGRRAWRYASVPAIWQCRSGAGSGGGLGSILPPIFGSGGSVRFPGSAVGGTPPFVPSSSGGGAGIGAAPAAGGIFSKAGLAGMLPGLKSFFGFGDNKWVDMGGGRMATGGWISQYGSFGDKLQALGKSDAALMGGALLAMDGLRRGGKIGVAETTAGGALIGYKFGGPLGAAIGGVAGAVAGIVRMFVKGAADKAKEKIKALYGVDIADKGVLQQIVDMAKSGFGGNLDMAIRSPQIRDLIQLYAMTTGQKTTGMPGTVTPLSLVETGGSLFQSPQYNNGTPLPALGGLPGLDQIGAGTPSGGGLVIQLDGPATTALLQGQAVQAITNNPRLVQSASMAATKSNANRRELTSLQLSPGTIVS